ncbi:MAG: PQQ-dependent sugar dehydrogenase [Chloroflexi bacterium]|nr:PQQ-dependent sugar dehydrogenase [Chloroflexota bacterium]
MLSVPRICRFALGFGALLLLSCAEPGPTSTHEPTATPPLPIEGSPSPTSAYGPLQPLRVERAFPNLTFRQLTNLVQPEGGQGHLFVTEQEGRILTLPTNPQAAHAALFLDISGQVSTRHNEEGLLGLAFDPDYQSNGYLYVYYSASNPRRSVLSRFSISLGDPGVAQPDSELVILEIPQPFGNHNGGQIAFGPDDYLYVGLGDGGSGGDPQGNGQDTGTLLGSILRIDVQNASQDTPYRIPPDNPFVGISAAREEIWAYGLRNPWRFSFDTEPGLLWAGDVGQNQWEEIDIVRKGLNYGWSITEGRHCFSPARGCDMIGLELPVAEYGRSQGCSVTGGYVYRGQATPWLRGVYVYGDFCSGRIWGLRYEDGAVTQKALLVESGLLITSFGHDLQGNLYVLSRSEGIYLLTSG